VTIAYPWNDESDFHTPMAKLGKHIIVTPEGEVLFVPEGAIILPVAAMTEAERQEATTLISTPVEARYEWAKEVLGMSAIREGH